MKPTILVVDDNWGIRNLLHDALAEDFDVVEATDGIFALSEVIGKQHVDLVITDLRMPELSGLDFIKNLPDDIPFIIISGYLQTPEYRKALERLNPVAVFEKPFKLSEMREAIHQALSS